MTHHHELWRSVYSFHLRKIEIYNGGFIKFLGRANLILFSFREGDRVFSPVCAGNVLWESNIQLKDDSAVTLFLTQSSLLSYVI